LTSQHTQHSYSTVLQATAVYLTPTTVTHTDSLMHFDLTNAHHMHILLYCRLLHRLSFQQLWRTLIH